MLHRITTPTHLVLLFILILFFVFTYVYDSLSMDESQLINRVSTESKGQRYLQTKDQQNSFIKADPNGIVLDDIQAYRSNLLIKRQHPKEYTFPRTMDFNINKSDVLVMLHIQKTGGSVFESHLVEDIEINPPCECDADTPHDRVMCRCVNDKDQDWLFNRYSTGWACGVHADYTTLSTCLDQWFESQPNEDRKRTYHIVTMVRDPIARFVSEWLHVRRGATWKEERQHCDGRDATLEEVPYCFKHDWINVTFYDFLACRHNMAFNRQTRMLANLSLSDCFRASSKHSREERDEIMLESAKENLLKRISFFGLTEYMGPSQLLFEKTFGNIRFRTNLDSKKTTHGASFALLLKKHWHEVMNVNKLDVRLYQYAKDLFLQRLQDAGISWRKDIRDSEIVPENFTYSFADNK